MYRFIKALFSKIAGTRLITFRLTTIISVILVLFAVMGWAMLPRPDVILSISARAETLAYRVIDRNAASISMGNVLLSQSSDDPFSDAPQRTCLSGRLLPESGIIVRYRRSGSGLVSIGFETDTKQSSAGVFEPVNGKAIALGPNDHLVLDPDDAACPAHMPSSFPIWGKGEIGTLRTFGTSLETEPGDLIEGEVRITARAVERFFFIFKGAKGLYDAGIVALPAGSKLASVDISVTDKATITYPWIGAARLGNGAHGSDFQIDVSTDSDTVWLYRAGLRKGGAPDTIGASAFVSQTRDPGVLGLQIALALLLIIIQTVASVMQTVEIRSSDDDQQ